MQLKIEVSLGKWLLTNKVKHLVWEHQRFGDILKDKTSFTDVYLHNNLKEIFYEKEDAQVRKDRDDSMEQMVATVSYTDEDGNFINIIGSYAIFVVNDYGKTIERIN